MLEALFRLRISSEPTGASVSLGLAGLLVVLLVNWRKYQPAWETRHWGILAALIAAAPLTALFLGDNFTTGTPLPMPGMPAESAGSTMMVLSAIPWTLAGGLLGPFAAAGIGILSGLDLAAELHCLEQLEGPMRIARRVDRLDGVAAPLLVAAVEAEQEHPEPLLCSAA